MFSPSSWPHVTNEPHPWVSSLTNDLIPRAIRIKQQSPYHSAVTPTIAHHVPDISTHIAALADEASIEIARFDTEIGHEIAPFASVLLRSESASSSMIENLSSGAKAIALAELGNTTKRNATEIVGNVHAMNAALALADTLNAPAIIDMHRALMSNHAPHIVGQWRDSQVWIGGDSYGPHEATFIPPHHTHITDAMSDLITFIQRNNIPILCHAAIAHAQFETIHPFPDGNGRTGRALIHAMLRSKGLTQHVTVPVSSGLLTDTNAYFNALITYRDGNLDPIVEQLANASFHAISNGRQLANDLRNILAVWHEATHARTNSLTSQLLNVLIRHPVLDTPHAAQYMGTTTKNALRIIDTLANSGILHEFTGHTRNRMWQATEVLHALDAFAGRSGNRTF